MKESVLGILRHVMTFGGGFGVSAGFLDEGMAVELVSATISLVGVIWSVIEKLNRPAA